MDPQGRYGLSPAPATPQALLSGPTPESPASRFRGGRAEDQLRLAERTFGEGGSNPGYTEAAENGFVSPLTQPLSTFGLDVDTGSYANVRRFLNAGSWPPRAAVRVEEMLNYFD
ncbi:MAG: von Willebrand factor type A domain-containing protein, partial [Verrucomicrobiales bacterium]|nr:von Willebrand factor type A domain-containing protein [Verrucomicrobiales bacterium]